MAKWLTTGRQILETMGCDIHSFAEVKRKNKWEKVSNHFKLDDFDKKYYKKEKGDEPLGWRSYSLFAFLADVRNYDYCTPISETKGFPKDASDEVKKEYEDWFGDAHSASNLTLKELIDFDYNKEFWDRRFHKNNNGASLANEGEGKIITYRDNLGEGFFDVIDQLKELGKPEEVRIVFWFDN